MQTDNENIVFELASQLVNFTGQPIFLTGKAGTGKTTFLKHIKAITKKNTVIVAPTGVAAINAGGVTMHSFFQLPLSPYIPQSYSGNKFGQQSEVADRNTLFKNIRFDKTKRNLINNLELLIIDEISMVRADLLDAIDAILRYFRRAAHLPFGGVQVLYIGDMYQLPPVVRDQEWQLLQDYYNSPFFFDSLVCKEQPPLYIELKKIYRQQDQMFIDILNRVRNNIPKPDDLDILNDLYNPSIDHTQQDAILLTTHNAKASTINEQELYKLNTPTHRFKGTIEGDFNDKLLPNELELELKEGAKVMFIRNDTGPEKKYFNGKLAIIKKIQDSKITVECTSDGEIFTLKQEQWKNVKFKLGGNNQIEEEEMGSFTQYPIRLAWAVTIHKSQGLTFDKVIIDAGKSFAAGQVYVALSRCTTLEGIILHSKIERSAINTDERIIKFAKQEAKEDEMQRVLELEKETFMLKQLLKQLQLSSLPPMFQELITLIDGKNLPDKAKATAMANTVLQKSSELNIVANKFKAEIEYLAQTSIGKLQERIPKAQMYFTNELVNNILLPLKTHTDELGKATKVRMYLKDVNEILSAVYTLIFNLNDLRYGDWHFNQYLTNIIKYNPLASGIPSKDTKADKTPSADVTFEMFKEGNDIAQIALIRNIAASTVEGHLAQKVRTGHIKIAELVAKEKMPAILHAITTTDGRALAPIKALLSDDYTFGEIRAVINHLDWELEQVSSK